MPESKEERQSTSIRFSQYFMCKLFSDGLHCLWVHSSSRILGSDYVARYEVESALCLEHIEIALETCRNQYGSVRSLIHGTDQVSQQVSHLLWRDADFQAFGHE